MASDLEKRSAIRYNAEFVIECLLLHIKSPKAYEHLRFSKLMTLPHPNYLRSMLRGISSKLGFQQFALKGIEDALKGKPFAECLGISRML